MKNIRSLLYTALCLLILTVLVSFILSILYFFNLFVSSLAFISKILGFIILMICGFLLGKNIKEKTFFYALGFAIIGFIITFFFVNKDMISISLLILKWILFMIVSLFSRNI